MFAFFKKPAAGVVATFETALGAARQPALYSDWGVPDTLDGRFDSLLLHLWPVFRDLQAHMDFTQPLYDLCFKRMELALRETGSGDLAVGRQVRAMMKAFYGRLDAYSACADDDALRAALRRNLYGTVVDDAFQVPDGVLEYAKKIAAMRVSLDEARLGRVIFPSL